MNLGSALLLGRALAAEPAVTSEPQQEELTLFDILEEFPPPGEVRPRIPEPVDLCEQRPMSSVLQVAFDARAGLIETLDGRPVECSGPRYVSSPEFGVVPTASFTVDAGFRDLRTAFMQKSELELVPGHHCRWSLDSDSVDSPTKEVMVVCFPRGLHRGHSPHGAIPPSQTSFIADANLP